LIFILIIVVKLRKGFRVRYDQNHIYVSNKLKNRILYI